MSMLSIDVGIKNLAICVLGSNKQVIEHIDVVDLRTGPNLRDALILELERQKPHFEGVEVVLVEQQLKKVFMVLAAYIEMWCKLSLPSARVLSYSSKHKLASVKVANQKWTYAQRKRASIKLVIDWLKDNPQNDDILDRWNAFSKKDDAADAICQALSYKFCADKSVKSIVARAPPQYHKQKLYARSHIKWLLLHDCEIDEKLRLSISKFYNSVPECRKALGMDDDAQVNT